MILRVLVRDLVFPAMVVAFCAACVSAGRPPGVDSQACGPGEAVAPTLEWFDSSSEPAHGSTTRTLARRDFFAEVPTAVFVSRQDEFVTYRGVVDWVGANRLEAWLVVPVEPSPNRDRFRDHLLVLPEHAGEGPWRGMVDQIRALFAPVPERPVPE